MRGFSLIEVLIVVGMVAILAAAVVPSFFQSRVSISFDSDVKLLVAALRDAQQRSITSEDSSSWGLCFTTGVVPQTYELRSWLSTYDCVSGLPVSRTSLSPYVTITSIFPPGPTIFNRIDGRRIIPASPPPQAIQLIAGSNSKTITIQDNGSISITAP